MDLFVARQAIFDRSLKVFGYELLYRSRMSDKFDPSAGDEATLHVITNSFLSIGAERMLGGGLAFVNCPQGLLTDERIELLPKSTTVIEILESVKPEPDVVAACRHLKDAGYLLALDDFVGQPGYEPLIELADIIKVDFPSLTLIERGQIRRRHGRGAVRLLAEKVETRREFQQALEMGYDYFQGYFFARPVTVKAREICGYRGNYLDILREIQKPGINRRRLVELIQREVSLTHRLLRYVNSAAFSRLSHVSTIQMAIAMLGDDGIRKWLWLAALPNLAQNKPSELTITAAVRARFCESMAAVAGLDGRQPDLFLMGLFSLLDAMLDRPLQELLGELHLSPEIEESLLGTGAAGNRLAAVLDAAQAYETGDWPELDACAARLNTLPGALPELYMNSVAWAEQIFRA